MEGKSVRRLIFLVFFLALFLLVARLFYPFLSIFLWSGLIYALLDPLFERIATRKDGKERPEILRSLLAGSFALGGVLILVLPIFFLGLSLFRQLGDLAQSVLAVLNDNSRLLDLSPEGPIGGFLYRASDGLIDLSSFNALEELRHVIQGSAARLISLSGTLLRKTTGLALTLAFMVFTLFFLFADGRHLFRVIVGAVPIERDYTRLFLRKLRDTSRQLVQGYFLVALYQAFAAFLIFSLFRVKGPLVLAALTAVASFIPMVGTGLVWLPVGLARLATGDLVGGLVLLALCSVFISLVDNFLRPFLLHGKLKIHPLLIFFSILGGLQLFGFNGLILGPLILILFFTGVRLYDRVYDRDDAEERESGEIDPDSPEGEVEDAESQGGSADGGEGGGTRSGKGRSGR